MRILTVLLFALAIAACENKKGHTEPVIYYEQTSQEQLVSDSTVTTQKNVCDPNNNYSSTSTSPTHSEQTPKIDNMRGFDPASEDDMDDNGMSRYMENDDDEGWD